jgi:hypothetical protein
VNGFRSDTAGGRLCGSRENALLPLHELLLETRDDHS